MVRQRRHEETRSRRVYFINELERAEDGGYIPCIAVEGETGYYRTDWNWGDDLKIAQQICDERNANLGFTPKEAALIQLRTMFQSSRQRELRRRQFEPSETDR